MTQVHRNRPKLPPYVSLPQCSAPMVVSNMWNKHYVLRRQAKMERMSYRLDRCGRGGSVNINGVDYCGQHGGQVALAILLCEEVDWNQPGDVEERK